MTVLAPKRKEKNQNSLPRGASDGLNDGPGGRRRRGRSGTEGEVTNALSRLCADVSTLESATHSLHGRDSESEGHGRRQGPPGCSKDSEEPGGTGTGFGRVKLGSTRTVIKRVLRLERRQHPVESNQELIPGLPLEDVAILCLAHVPLSSVPVVRAVCKKWRNVVDSEKLFEVRRQEKIAEAWLCALEWGALGTHDMFAHLWAFDTVLGNWNDIGRLPRMGNLSPGSRMIALGTSLFFLGGALPPDEFDRFHPVGEVWKYDLLTRNLYRVASMITPRDRFASTVMGGKLYVAGGLGTGWSYAHDPLRSAEVYDPESDSWRALPDMPHDETRMPALECQGGTVNGKFYVRGGGNKGLADIYDPRSNSWGWDGDWFPSDMSAPYYTRMESADKRMYLLDTYPPGRTRLTDRTHQLRVFKESTQKWTAISPLPVGGFVGAVSMAGIGDQVYLAGGEDSRSDPDETWASRLPFNGRLGKVMAEPCLHVYNMGEGVGRAGEKGGEGGSGGWEPKNPPQLGVVTRWLGTCAIVEA